MRHRVYLCFLRVHRLLKWIYFVIDIKKLLITLLRNNMFQRNLLVTLSIHWESSVRNFIRIR